MVCFFPQLFEVFLKSAQPLHPNTSFMSSKPSVAIHRPLRVVSKVQHNSDEYQSSVGSDRERSNLGLLLRSLGDGIWEWNVEQKVLHGNRIFHSMIGVKPGAALTLFHSLRRIHYDDFFRLKKRLQRAVRHRNSYCQNRVRLRQADGSFQLVMLRTFFIYENRSPVHIIGSVLDISEILQLEAALTKEKEKQQLLIAETALRVQESERTRIGQELHDNVNQILATAKLFIESTKVLSEADQERRAKSLEYLALAIEENRKLSRELVAPSLKQYGLVENIQHMLQDIALASPTAFSFHYDPTLRHMTPDKRIMLFRVVQEQVKNILRHSKATAASISFNLVEENIQLIIRDNGKGFSKNDAPGGIGLSNMRERVSLYSGKVTIESKPDEGCVLTVIVPV